MNMRRKAAVFVSALAMAVGSGVLTAAPASADVPCSSNNLCLYKSTQFREKALSTGSVADCHWLKDYQLTYPSNGIMAYRNNLPVKVTLWYYWGSTWTNPANWSGPQATIAPGASSSDTTGGDPSFKVADKVCTGDAKPWQT